MNKVLNFSEFLLESSGNGLTDSEIADLIRVGILDPLEIGKSQVESKLGIKLSEQRVPDIEHLRSRVRAYRIVDGETRGSNAILLYLRCTVDGTGVSKLSEFCFENSNRLNLPLNVHSVSELIGLKRANELFQYYYTNINKLTRKAYLSAIDNSDFTRDDNDNLQPRSFLRSKGETQTNLFNDEG